jgi:3-hydroxyisobutyrate dehydrogenase-like beta-hydroxyacid dehydrogenase
MKVAFLGLGIMGQPMAANLVKAGHEVTVWNRTPGKTVEGARTAATAAEAASSAEAVWLCVTNNTAVEQVLFGENGVAGVLRPGMIVADSSTISPQSSRDFGRRIAALGASFVDAPVTGSKPAAISGELVFIVGGAEADLARLQPLFDAMGKKVIHFGEVGAGESAKIGLNMCTALTFEALAESFTLTAKLGVPFEKFAELIQSSMSHSGVSDFKLPFLARRDFAPNFPLRLMHKDIRIMLETAEQAGVALPALRTLEHVVYQSSTEFNNEDFIATIKTLEALSHCPPVTARGGEKSSEETK